MTEPRQYGGHHFRWSGSWVLPDCDRCGRRDEDVFSTTLPHDQEIPGMTHDPRHPEPCPWLGHYRAVYPVCTGNKIALFEEQRDAAAKAADNASAWLVRTIERLQAERDRVAGG